jgi:uncharacterized damage-inducible protein DinB
MFTRDGLQQYYVWTHYTLDRLFEHCSGFSPEELAQELEGFGIPTLWDQLAHMLITEEHWVGWLRTGSHHTLRPSKRTWAELTGYRSDVMQRSSTYIASLDDVAINGEVTLVSEDGSRETATRAFFLHHVLSHAFHHKGQVAAMCRLLGKPFTQDMDLLYAPDWFADS